MNNIDISSYQRKSSNFEEPHKQDSSPTYNSFVKISSPLIDFIVGTNKLNSSEKLYYLVNSFYHNLIHNRKNKHVAFSAKKIGNLLGFSKTKVFSIQRKLEQKEFLIIKRSLDQNGSNNTNAAIPSLPDNVFLSLAEKCSKTDTANSEKVMKAYDSADKMKITHENNMFIPLYKDLVKQIFFHKTLSTSSKLVFLGILSSLHKIKQQNKYDLYAGALDLQQLLSELGISASTLTRALSQLKKEEIIKVEKLRVKS